MILSFDSRQSLIQRLAEDDSDTPYLILENFQSIAKATAIPMRRLTFLYGPNSAGKSAIGDAIEVLRSLWSGPDRPTDLPARSHRTGSSMAIGLSIRSNLSSLDDRLGQAIADEFPEGPIDHPRGLKTNPWDSSPWEATAPVRITWIADGIVRYWGAAVADEHVTYIGSKVLAILSASNNEEKGFPFQLRTYRNALLVLAVTKSNYDKLTRCLGSAWDSDESRSAFLDKLEADLGVNVDRDETARELWGDEADRTNQTQIVRTYSPMFEGAWIGLKNKPRFFESTTDESDSYFMRLVFTSVLASLKGIADWYLVGPSRAIPKSGRLRYLTEGPSLGAKPLDVETGVADADSGGAWGRIANSCLMRGGWWAKNSEPMLDAVNRWLGDTGTNSFSTGYQIKADVQFLLHRDEFKKSRSKKVSTLTITEAALSQSDAFVDLRIVNPAGQTLSLQDVGTGFSHLVPVIVGTIAPTSVAMIEQPELHLHPALQGRIADLLIEEANGKRKHRLWTRIIETHSEHIAIRLLRRMRETSQAPSALVEVARLEPSDLALLYFEPFEHETVVHEIRISPDGEFIDRWPTGFFTEREDDLFDGD
jgi:hypothetical protein